MQRPRVTIMFIGILVCVPVLALYQFGLFPQLAEWLRHHLSRLLVLPEGGIETNLSLQYGYYTALAFLGAWLGLELPSLWHRLLFLIGLSYLTLSLSVTLAWSGLLFEPFSGLLAAWTSTFLATGTGLRPFRS